MLKSKVSAKIDSKALRTVASAFATGITVITVEQQNIIYGMTANSFVSISLDPAIVMFSVRNEAQILSAISIEKAIGINILKDSQKDLSEHFAGITSNQVKPIYQDINGTKILEDSLAYYCCTVRDMIECGDHKMILCNVIDCQRNEGNPLLYYSGYATIGDLK